MENQQNSQEQINLSKEDLENFVGAVRTLLNLQLGNLKFKSLVRDEKDGMLFIFCDDNNKETIKNISELKFRVGDKNNSNKNEFTITTSDVSTPVNPIMNGGGFLFSETSSDAPKFKNSKKNYNKTNSDMYSQTSPMPNINPNLNMKGGAMSETSPMPSNYKNMVVSETSPMDMRGGAMSETSPMLSNYKNMVLSDTSYTSAMGMNLSSMKGGKHSRKINNQASSDIYSATSNLALGQGQNNFRGGALSNSDTINFTSDSNLDTSIFKKPTSSQQKGGSTKLNNNLKNQMKDMGIGSTSTSSVCE